MAYAAYGKVFLVGAGPGDPALITVKGAECVRRADVILFDRLVHPRIWSSRKGECELIYVGKTPERSVLEQDEINGLLVEKARAGKTVVRLKGGDPFVFGRGGEEALALAEAGIDFEIVPGVTAAIATAAYAGIPVTHRGVSAGLTLATAHEAPAREKDAAVDWAKIAATGGTVAAYMGVKNLRRVCRELRAGGMPPDTPVAVIQDGTLPEQRTITGTLATIADLAGKAGIKPPATAVFGEGGEGVHVVQAVGKLDEHHAHVVHHGQEHLAQALGFLILEVPAAHLAELADLTQLGHPIHQTGYLVAELLA